MQHGELPSACRTDASHTQTVLLRSTWGWSLTQRPSDRSRLECGACEHQCGFNRVRN